MAGERMILKRSYEQGKVPNVSDLRPGEFCYNVADGILYGIKGDLSVAAAKDIVSIQTAFNEVLGITGPELESGVYYAWITFVEASVAALYSEGCRVIVNITEAGYTGEAYYVADIDESDNKIKIEVDNTKSSYDGEDGECRLYGETAEAVLTYDGDAFASLSANDTINITGLYEGEYEVASHDSDTKEITISVKNFGNTAGVGTVAKYDFELVTFLSTAESLRKDLIDAVLEVLDVNIILDSEDRVENVKLVRRDSANNVQSS